MNLFVIVAGIVGDVIGYFKKWSQERVTQLGETVFSLGLVLLLIIGSIFIAGLLGILSK
jgi:type III secretory pathway component EscS